MLKDQVLDQMTIWAKPALVILTGYAVREIDLSKWLAYGELAEKGLDLFVAGVTAYFAYRILKSRARKAEKEHIEKDLSAIVKDAIKEELKQIKNK